MMIRVAKQRGGLTAAVLVLAASAMTACGSSAFSGGTGDNARALLDQADAAFTDRLADEVDAGAATVSEASRCFMQEDDSEAGVAPHVFCGPARSITDSAGEPVWYGRPMSITDDGDAVSFDLADTAFDTVEVDLDTLIHPDGVEPAGGTDLPEPQPPRATLRDSAVLTSTSAEFIGADFEPFDEPRRLITPSAVLSVHGVAHPELLPEALVGGEATVQRPAEGQVVTAMQVSVDPATPRLDYEVDDSIDTSVDLVVGAGQRSIPVLTPDGDGGDADGPTLECAGPECHASREYVVVVTADTAEVALTAVVDERAQTLDLDSGEITSDVSQVAYHRDTLHVETNIRWDTVTHVVRSREQLEAELGDAIPPDFAPGGATYEYGGSVTDVYLTAFELAHGWAPAGKAWVVVPIEGDPASASGEWQARVNRETSWTLTTPSGSIRHSGGDAADVAVFLVDDDLTSATFVYRPTGTVTEKFVNEETVTIDEVAYPFTAEQPLEVEITLE